MITLPCAGQLVQHFVDRRHVLLRVLFVDAQVLEARALLVDPLDFRQVHAAALGGHRQQFVVDHPEAEAPGEHPRQLAPARAILARDRDDVDFDRALRWH